MEQELTRLDRVTMRDGAHDRALRDLEGADGRIDMMVLLARRVPMATMAGALGVADEEGAAEAACTVAGGYFPGSGPDAEARATRRTMRLVELLGPGDEDVLAARIALMVQGCDATAGVIGNTLHLIREAPEHAVGSSTESLIREVLRDRSPSSPGGGSRMSRPRSTAIRSPRVTRSSAASRRRTTIPRPSRCRTASIRGAMGRRASPSATDSAPCPGAAQAVMLAAGVVDAVRERCVLTPDPPVEFEAAAVLRIPSRLEVQIR